MPLGVVAPRTIDEAERAHRHLPRGGRAGDCRAAAAPRNAGQTVNHSRDRRLLEASQPHPRSRCRRAAAARSSPASCSTISTAQLKPHGLWFPVDVSTASRATIGGMTANNSCGGRSLRYGNTRDNVLVDRRAAGRRQPRRISARSRPDLSDLPADSPLRPLARDLLAHRRARGRRDRGALSRRCSAASAATIIDALVPGRNDVNLAHILVGSEGTLAFSTAIELKLSPVLGKRAVGACHFGSFHEAMDGGAAYRQARADRGRAGRRAP